MKTAMQLLEKFQPLFNSMPDTLPSDMTFFEISGYPHYENVCSNILKFYLNPKVKNNCLGDLVLTCLLASAGKLSAPFSDLDNLTVKREVATKDGRLDLLIYTNKWVIAIENKIRHTLQNNLEEYAEFLEREFVGRKIFKLVLSIKPEHDLKGGFQNLLYKDFIANIEAKFNNGNFDRANPYVIYFLHFVQNLKNQFLTMHMEKEEIEFVINNQEKIAQVTALNQKLNDYIRHRAYAIMDAITVGANYRKWVYENYDVGFNYINGNTTYKLECPINTNSIEIHLCVETNKIDFKELEKLALSKKYDIGKLPSTSDGNKLILERGISFFISDSELIEKLKAYLADFKIVGSTDIENNAIQHEQFN